LPNHRYEAQEISGESAKNKNSSNGKNLGSGDANSDVVLKLMVGETVFRAAEGFDLETKLF
jgi:hypothetical protein